MFGCEYGRIYTIYLLRIYMKHLLKLVYFKKFGGVKLRG